MTWNYSNTSVETTLTSTITAGATSITVGSTSGLPVTFPYTLVIDIDTPSVEVVTVTGLAGLNLTVTRGQDGTAAQAHNAGAKVVHGVVARDVQEPQNHIAASANVHGVGATASVVGTDTAQTLTNKTISGASNTLSAIPTSALVSPLTDVVVAPSVAAATSLEVRANAAQTADILRVKDATGAVVFRTTSAGDGRFDKQLTVFRPLATDAALKVAVGGDTDDRCRIQADGKMLLGPGNAPPDTNLYRSAANELKTDDTLSVGSGTILIGADVNLRRSAADVLKTDDNFEALSLTVVETAAANLAINTKVTGDANNRLAINTDGKMAWGPGTAAADTNLYRSAANTLRTDDGLSVGGSLTVGGSATVTGSVSAASFSASSTTTGLVVASGFTLNSFLAKQAAGVCTVFIYLAVTTAITATSGNINDTLMCTLPLGWRPPDGAAAIYGNGTMDGEALILPDGTVVLRSASATINSATNIRLCSTYVL